MATHFVDSAAAGANDGTSWTNAWTSAASSSGVAAGDIVKVDDGHSQTNLGANVTWTNGTLTNPVRIICVDKNNSDAHSTGAVIGWTTGQPIGNVYSYGITWQHTGNLQPQAPSQGKWESENCTFKTTGNAIVGPNDGTRSATVWKNCNVDLSASGGAGVAFDFSAMLGTFQWTGGTYTLRGTQTTAFSGNLSPMMRAVIEGVQIVGTVTNLFATGVGTSLNVDLRNCKLPTYTNYVTTGATTYVNRMEVLGASGTITVPVLPVIVDGLGVITGTTARYRTGGADDGEQANAYSWEMVSNASAADFSTPLVSPQITRWVDTGSQALKVYVASGVTLQDDEFWIEVLSPSEAGSATSQAHYRSTRPAPLATPANLTTDGSSTWNGAGVGTKQYCTVTIAPTVAGEVTVRVHLAKPSTTVYVDPVIDVAGDVAGKSRFIQGVQMFDATEAGGGSGGGERPTLLGGILQ